MLQKTEIEMQRAKAIKITRALIRLKHSLAADEEINQILPDRLLQFEKALQAGELLELPVPEGIE
jgi:hypothetical protein